MSCAGGRLVLSSMCWPLGTPPCLALPFSRCRRCRGSSSTGSLPCHSAFSVGTLYLSTTVRLPSQYSAEAYPATLCSAGSGQWLSALVSHAELIKRSAHCRVSVCCPTVVGQQAARLLLHIATLMSDLSSCSELAKWSVRCRGQFLLLKKLWPAGILALAMYCHCHAQVR